MLYNRKGLQGGIANSLLCSSRRQSLSKCISKLATPRVTSVAHALQYDSHASEQDDIRDECTCKGLLQEHGNANQTRESMKAHAHKLERGYRVPGAAAIRMIGSGICRGNGCRPLGIQIEDMHSAFITGHCQVVGWVSSGEGDAKNPCWVSSPSQLLEAAHIVDISGLCKAEVTRATRA